jgi:nucleoside-diphosphate-sugar epimerase
LNTSAASFYKVLLTEGSGGLPLDTPGGQWIDVRDVASAHVLSLEKEDAGDQRMIIAFGAPFTIFTYDSPLT